MACAMMKNQNMELVSLEPIFQATARRIRIVAICTNCWEAETPRAFKMKPIRYVIPSPMHFNPVIIWPKASIRLGLIIFS
jgi:hypothetical protein